MAMITAITSLPILVGLIILKMCIRDRMAAYQAEHSQPTEAYVVRGALLHCQYGSHCRRMNLPLCHGVYTMKKPLVFKRDCKGGTEGADINIPTFGVCSCPGNPTGGSVCLEKEAPRNPDGSFTGEAASGTVTGTPVSYTHLDVYKRQSPAF